MGELEIAKGWNMLLTDKSIYNLDADYQISDLIWVFKKNMEACIEYKFLSGWEKKQKLISVGLMSISFFINHRGML